MTAQSLYRDLQRDQIRLLEFLKTDTDDEISFRLSYAYLHQYQHFRQQGVDNDTESRHWPELYATKYNYAHLFSNKDLHSGVRSYRQAQHAAYLTPSVSSTIQVENGDLSGSYAALSYVWGPSDLNRSILVDGLSVPVTDNLYEALSQLRYSHAVKQGLKLWADAVCINQADPEERATQVQLMRNIYASAWQVVVWLGPHHPEFTELAFTAVSWIAGRRYEEEGAPLIKKGVEWSAPHLLGFMQMHRQANTVPFRNEVVLSLWHMFTLNYWRRLWILQEAALARDDAPVLWGLGCVSVSDIRAAAVFIERNERWLGRRITCAVGNGMPLQLAPQDFTRDRDISHRDAAPARLWKLVIRILAKQPQSVQESNLVLDGFEVLELARSANATDERDKVFAILGLSKIKPLVSIVPNYRLQAADIYTEFSSQLVRSGDLNALRLVQAPLDSLSTAWLFKHEPWTISYQFRLQYFNPFWPPKNLRSNLQILGQSVIGGRPSIDTIPPCDHGLASWVICLSCPSAPVFAFPKAFNADLGIFNNGGSDVRLNGTALHVRGVLIDSVASMSAFHDREHDLQYPLNDETPQHVNAYYDIAGVRNALWRTLLADRLDNFSPIPTDYSNILLNRTVWTAATLDLVFSMSQMQFGLPFFYRRNKSLKLCGHKLEDLLISTSARSSTARTSAPKSETQVAAFQIISRATNLLAWRRLICTRDGRIGLVPAAARQHDRIVVLKGCGMPLVLRPQDGHFKVVGECYVHGIMNGEVAEMVKTGQADIVDVELR